MFQPISDRFSKILKDKPLSKAHINEITYQCDKNSSTTRWSDIKVYNPNM